MLIIQCLVRASRRIHERLHLATGIGIAPRQTAACACSCALTAKERRNIPALKRKAARTDPSGMVLACWYCISYRIRHIQRFHQRWPHVPAPLNHIAPCPNLWPGVPALACHNKRIQQSQKMRQRVRRRENSMFSW